MGELLLTIALYFGDEAIFDATDKTVMVDGRVVAELNGGLLYPVE
jgi:hypothetical protein